MVKELLLGKPTGYIQQYTPDLLFPVPRTLARERTNISEPLPFIGEDIWNGSELSWLNKKGKPQIALAEFAFPCTSPYLVESKSFKLYLNSFNQSHFASIEEVLETLFTDLSAIVQSNVRIRLLLIEEVVSRKLTAFQGICLDDVDIETETYTVTPSFLQTRQEIVQEALYSNLLKSNCMATGQPDWGSILIRYKGNKIEREGLLKYIISYRNHTGFAEHCAEQIFQEIMENCQPELLTVYIRYSRRGGLDINPFRSNYEETVENHQQFRQ